MKWWTWWLEQSWLALCRAVIVCCWSFIVSLWILMNQWWHCQARDHMSAQRWQISFTHHLYSSLIAFRQSSERCSEVMTISHSWLSYVIWILCLHTHVCVRTCVWSGVVYLSLQWPTPNIHSCIQSNRRTDAFVSNSFSRWQNVSLYQAALGRSAGNSCIILYCKIKFYIQPLLGDPAEYLS